MKKISVLLVDDHTVVRQGLRALLQAEEDMEVVGEAENGRQAVGMARKTPPDVVVMDVAMPMLNGLEATRQILKNRPGTKVLVLTSYGDDDCVAQLMRAGASGYLGKPVSDEQIEPALAVALNRFAELRELNGEVSDLKEALEARKVVERAKGILMRRLQFPEDEAYRHLQKLSRDRRQTLKQTAQQILDAAELLG